MSTEVQTPKGPTSSLSENLSTIERVAFRVAIGGGVLLLLGLLFDREHAFQAYLTSYLYWLGPALGSMAIVMLHNMVGGRWGFAIHRLLEAGMRTLPWMALLFLPLGISTLLGWHSLYPWADPEIVADDAIIQKKVAYLNVPFFLVRAVLYFALWLGFSRWLLSLADRYDHTFSVKALRRIKTVSGIGLGLYVLSISFASFDWGMSTEPHWFSTIYGIHYLVGQGLTTFAFAIVVASRLARHEPFSRWYKVGQFHDLGNLLMAFTMLWAYVSFSQFLIIWSGNLPEETPYYLRRLGHGWQALALFLVIAHFAVPFLVLLQRRVKTNSKTLAKVAMGILIVRYLDYFWVIKPAFQAHGAGDGHGYPHFSVSWLDVVTPIALGGLWVGLFVKNLRGRPLVSLQDGRLLQELEAPASGDEAPAGSH